jgi:hypothetical protein
MPRFPRQTQRIAPTTSAGKNEDTRTCKKDKLSTSYRPHPTESGRIVCLQRYRSHFWRGGKKIKKQEHEVFRQQECVSSICLLLLVRQADYIVNLSDFYSYRLIEKLTAFLQLQEFSFREPTVTSSTSDARISHNSLREKLVCLSLREQLYVLILT